MNKPTVFNYQDYLDLKQAYDDLKEENQRLRDKIANLEIRCRIAETENPLGLLHLNFRYDAGSAEAAPQSEQYKKGFEDAKRAILVEYARECESMRKRNAQLEVMLNAQKAISADAIQGR